MRVAGQNHLLHQQKGREDLADQEKCHTMRLRGVHPLTLVAEERLPWMIGEMRYSAAALVRSSFL